LLTLAQAISVIMGANIGTTFTAWIMSLGYNVDLTIVVFPAFFLGIMLIYSKKRRYFGDFLFGIAFLFFSLVLLSSAGKALDLEHNPAVIDFFGSFDTKSHFTIVVFLLIGTLITCIVQSSAAVMAITILLCSTGVLPIYLGIALVMGENIGTTATANLAALGANAQARRAALAHLVFNVFGVIWVLCLFYPFVDFVCSIVGYDPDGNVVIARLWHTKLVVFAKSGEVSQLNMGVELIILILRAIALAISPITTISKLEQLVSFQIYRGFIDVAPTRLIQRYGLR
jgi:phosphate:Na+ symporter